MKLGISSYTYAWAVGVDNSPPAHPLDEHGLLDKAAELGVKLLQIADNLPLHTFTATRLDRLASRAQAEGVELEVGARRLTLEHFEVYAKIARQLKVRLIRFVIDDRDYHPEPKEVTALLRAAVPMLEGITLGIENHDRFPARVLRETIENADSDAVGICLDTANSIGAGEGLEAVADILGPLTVNLHLKDFQIERIPGKMGFTVSGRPAGSGFLNAPQLIKQIRSFNRCKSAVLELWPPPESRLEETILKESSWAVQSIQYLKPFFG